MKLKSAGGAGALEDAAGSRSATSSSPVASTDTHAPISLAIAAQPGLPDRSALFSTVTAAERFRSEVAWLQALPGLTTASSSVLAAHTVACMMSIKPLDYCGGGGSTPLSDLASVFPNQRALDRIVSTLMQHDDPSALLSAEDLACIDALWPLTAPVEYLLASGGDDRLLLDPVTGLNKYGCAPWPRPELISYGSCTASSLSAGAFAAAERARRALVASATATSPATALAEASEAISLALLRHFDVEDLADAVLAASGTDAALVATGLLAAEHPGESMTSILVSPSETGSGVPDAVQGRHFASSAPTGSLVGKGQPIDGLDSGPSLVTVALRDANGLPRRSDTVTAEFEAAIRSGIATGRVVLHAVDGSKTGLTAPDRVACRRLAQAYGPKLDIVIDACQARIEPAVVRWYLQAGFPVLVTGSKFFTAPGFCGAVLFPRMRLRRITRAGRLPAGLAAYARLQGGFGSRRCPGLILRWTAALHEMTAFGQVPAGLVRSALDRFGSAVNGAIGVDRRLEIVEAPRPTGMGWSDRRSVFTFTVRGKEGLLGSDDLRRLYRRLAEGRLSAFPNCDVLCQVGQPVELGGGGVAGLRIAASAAQIASGEDQTEGLMLALQKLRSLTGATE